MQLGNKTTVFNKIRTMGNKITQPFTVGQKIANKASNIMSSISSNIPMHHALTNNISNSVHSVFAPTGLKRIANKKKSSLEK